MSVAVSAPGRPRLRFTSQVRLLVAALVTGLVLVALGLFWVELRADLEEVEKSKALSVARATAAVPGLAEAVQNRDLNTVTNIAGSVEDATGALFVVVTDRDGIRLAHPNPARVGERVSTDPTDALAGREVANVEQGTLGLSVRGKVPLRTPDRAIVGEVSIGFDANELSNRLVTMVFRVAPVALGALLCGWAATELLTRMLKRKTRGLEPDEVTELVREREAVLHGVAEGVLAFDANNRITASNRRAQELFGHPLPPGAELDEVGLPARVRAAVDAEEPTDELAVAGPRMLVFTVRRLRLGTEDIGGVVTLRDRTELQSVLDERDSVRLMTSSLRAQRHEYANRLQTLSGLLTAGDLEEARDYLRGITSADSAAENLRDERVDSATIRSFLAAKTAQCAERGVVLELSENTYLPGRLRAPAEVITVLGNLVDNALDASVSSKNRPRRIEVDLVADGADMMIFVADSGDGVPADSAETIFEQGVSARGEGRGFGLATVRQVVRSLGGEIELVHTGPTENGGLAGAVFRARLPEMLQEEQR